MKNRILIGLISAALIFVPAFAACKKTPPKPPLYNTEAEEELTSVFDFSFFPFDSVEVTELTYNPDFVGFKFTCADFDGLKNTITESLLDQGFVKDENTLSFSKNINYVIHTITISTNENFYELTISTHDYVNPLNPEVEALLYETFGFDFFPMEHVQVVEIFNDETFTGFKFDCLDFVNFKETITNNLLDQGFVKETDALSFSKNINYVVYTITISTNEKLYELTISKHDYVNPLNPEVEALLSETFDFDFFPMEHVQVVEFFNDQGFTGFKFDCMDFDSFKETLTKNLTDLGFVKDENLFAFSKNIHYVVYTILISTSENSYVLTISSQDYVNPLNAEVETLLSQTFDFDFFPMEHVQVVEIFDEEGFTGFEFDCLNENDFKLTLSENLLALGFSQDGENLTFTKMIGRYLYTLTIVENGDYFNFTYSKINPLNLEAKSKLEEVLGGDAFPFNLVDVVSLSGDESFEGFTFECENFRDFKLAFNNNMQALGFTVGQEELTFTKEVDKTILTVIVSEVEGNYQLSFRTEERPLSDVEKLAAKLSEAFGFEFVLPDGVSVSLYDDESGAVSCCVENIYSDELIEYFTAVLSEHGIAASLDGGVGIIFVGDKTIVLIISPIEETNSCSVNLSF